MQNRLKSPVFWSGIAVLIINFLIAIDIITIEQSESLKTAVSAVLSAIAGFAVANNPTSKANF
jgi:uncharacterized membrane protein